MPAVSGELFRRLSTASSNLFIQPSSASVWLFRRAALELIGELLNMVEQP
jgi:hypothetical protein